jgi:type IV secretory pathway TrbD component
MPIERETIIERSAPTETVVTGGGSPFGIIGGIIAAVVAVLLIIWLINGGISSNGDAVNVDLPEVTVTE